jgi:tetratricopeptide (TPR) repeat protein
MQRNLKKKPNPIYLQYRDRIQAIYTLIEEEKLQEAYELSSKLLPEVDNLPFRSHKIPIKIYTVHGKILEERWIKERDSGNLIQAEKFYQQALTYYKLVLNVRPFDWRGHVTLGAVLSKHKDYEEAIKILEKFINTKKFHNFKNDKFLVRLAQAYTICAYCYMHLEPPNLLKAKEYAEKAVNADPNYDSAWSRLAKCFKDMGLTEKGEHCFEIMRKLNPERLERNHPTINHTPSNVQYSDGDTTVTGRFVETRMKSKKGQEAKAQSVEPESKQPPKKQKKAKPTQPVVVSHVEQRPKRGTYQQVHEAFELSTAFTSLKLMSGCADETDSPVRPKEAHSPRRTDSPVRPQPFETRAAHAPQGERKLSPSQPSQRACAQVQTQIETRLTQVTNAFNYAKESVTHYATLFSTKAQTVFDSAYDVMKKKIPCCDRTRKRHVEAMKQKIGR